MNGKKREALCTLSPNLPFISYVFGMHLFILICEVFILRSHKKLL